MTRRRTVEVPVSELRALRAGWRAFLADEGAGFDSLGDAVLAILQREARARRGTVGVQRPDAGEDEAP